MLCFTSQRRPDLCYAKKKCVWIATQTHAENKGLFYLPKSHRKPSWNCLWRGCVAHSPGPCQDKEASQNVVSFTLGNPNAEELPEKSQYCIKKNKYWPNSLLLQFKHSFFSKHSGEREKFIPFPFSLSHTGASRLSHVLSVFSSLHYTTQILSTSEKYLIIYNYCLVQEVMCLMLKPESCPNVQQEIKPLWDP